jgi:hypothetical protein
MRIDPRHAVAVLALAAVWSGSSAATPTGAGPPLRADAAAHGPGYLHITAVAPRYAGREASDERWLIYLEGYIDTGAATRFERVLDNEHIRSAVVYFDSPGGHVIDAMALGRVLRKRRFETSVGARTADAASPRAGRCYSACPIAYAGGVHGSLEPGSVLGVHRAENSVPVPDESSFQGVVAGQLRGYLAEMGISRDLVTIMAAVPSNTIRELTTDEAVKLGLVNADESATGPR